MMTGKTQTNRGSNDAKKNALTKEAQRHDTTASSSSTNKKAVVVSFGLLAVLIAAMPLHVGARLYNKNPILPSREIEPTIKQREQAAKGFLLERTTIDHLEEGSNDNITMN